MSATLIGGILNNLGKNILRENLIKWRIYKVFGYLSDVYGRKLIFSLTNVLYIVLRWTLSFLYPKAREAIIVWC